MERRHQSFSLISSNDLRQMLTWPPAERCRWSPCCWSVRWMLSAEAAASPPASSTTVIQGLPQVGQMIGESPAGGTSSGRLGVEFETAMVISRRRNSMDNRLVRFIPPLCRDRSWKRTGAAVPFLERSVAILGSSGLQRESDFLRLSTRSVLPWHLTERLQDALNQASIATQWAHVLTFQWFSEI